MLASYDLRRMPALVLPRLPSLRVVAAPGDLVVVHREGWAPIFATFAGWGDPRDGFLFSEALVKRLRESDQGPVFFTRLLVMPGVHAGDGPNPRARSPKTERAYRRWGGRERERTCMEAAALEG